MLFIAFYGNVPVWKFYTYAGTKSKIVSNWKWNAIEG